MKNLSRALAFILALMPVYALAQSAPATLGYHTVYGRIGAQPGDSGPGQAIPFATLGPQIGVSKDKIVSILDYGTVDITGVVDAGPIIRAAMPQLGPGAVLHFPAGKFLIDSCVNNDGFGLSATAVKDNAISIVGTSSTVWSTGTVFVLGPNFPDACSAIHTAGTTNIFGRRFEHFSIQPYTGVYGAGVGTHAIFVDGTNNDVYFEYHLTITDVQIGNMKLGQSIKSFAAATNPGGGALNNATIENSILMSVNLKNVGDNIAFNRVTVGQQELRGDPGYTVDMIAGAASIVWCGGIIANANGSIIFNGGINPVLGCGLELESNVANSHGSMVDFTGATSKILGGSMSGVTISQNFGTGTIFPVRIANAENVSIGPNNRLATSSGGGVHISVTAAATNPSTNGNYCTTAGTAVDCNVGNASGTINSPKVNFGMANGTDAVNVGGFMTVGGLHLPGGTSGTFTFLPPLVAGTGMFRFSTGTSVDMLSTGGAGQVLQQATLGGAMTVGTVAITVNGTTCTTGSSCTPPSNIVVGSSTVTGGSTATNDLFFNNGGVIGRIASANNSIFVTNGSGVGSLSTTLPAHTLGGAITGASQNITGLGTIASTAHTITSASANALAVGPNGTTNPSLQVDASTASAATGLKIGAAAAGGGLNLQVISSGTNEGLGINAKGTGVINIGSLSTGLVTISPNVTHSGATTLSAALTYGGVALNNAVTGTGNMVLSTSPALTTPNIGAATATTVNGASIAPGQYTGEPTTGSATAGNVGEYIESNIASGSAVALVNGTPKDITTISLTAGDWDVEFIPQFTGAAGTTVSYLSGSISLTLNTFDLTNGRFSVWPGTGSASFATGAPGPNFVSTPSFVVRMSLSGTTTIHAVAQASFGVSTCSGFGLLRARRAR